MKTIQERSFLRSIRLVSRAHTMASHTTAKFKRINAEDLRDILLSPKASSVAVIDVRGDDHVGGHIRGSSHVPISSLDYKLPELIRKLAGKEKVVFHCALSQERGPTAALRYLRERQGKEDKGELPEDAIENAHDSKEGGGDDAKEAIQEVYVLDKGFVGWQGKYGRDERLTEAYAPDVWEDY